MQNKSLTTQSICEPKHLFFQRRSRTFPKFKTLEKLEKLKIAYICGMQKVVTKSTLHDKSTDLVYWRSQSEESRLEAIELLRQQYIQFQGNVQQEVYRVTNTAPSH